MEKRTQARTRGGAGKGKPRRSSLRMLLRFAFVGLLAALVMIAVSGVVYEKIGEWQDRRHFPQIGRSVDIGGRTLNLYCSGQGSPTVILESGHSISGLGWAVIQPRVASFTRACWYDRAGYGWSDSGSFPQHSNQIAQDLHRLLTSAGERPPYVLAGHLFGAFNVRAFQHFYPQEVAGMVLIDPQTRTRRATIRPFLQIIMLNRSGLPWRRLVGRWEN